MKTIHDKQKFIELRAKGLSFSRISEELVISKPTLLKWNQEYSKEIANLLFLHYETLLNQFQIEKSARIKSMAMLLNKALEELKSRSLAECSSKELLTLIEYADRKLSEELGSIRYITDDWQDPAEELRTDALTTKTLPFSY